MEMGQNAGARTALVLTGYGKGNYEYHRSEWPRPPDLIAENLLEAVGEILAETTADSGGGSARRRCLRREAQHARFSPTSGSRRS